VITFIKKKRGLSEVITTLMLLVVAVLIATITTFYATNITMTRTQTESVHLSMEHVWVNSTGAVAAFKMSNVGGRDILIDKFSVRGVDSNWSSVYIYRVPSGTSITTDLTVSNYTDMSGASFAHSDGRTYTQVSADIPLSSGSELLVYVSDPDNIQINDVGATVSMSISTANARYITEVNVESATTQ
jgi:flagellin-like protein